MALRSGEGATETFATKKAVDSPFRLAYLTHTLINRNIKYDHLGMTLSTLR
jgi:hypothetical protein